VSFGVVAGADRIRIDTVAIGATTMKMISSTSMTSRRVTSCRCSDEVELTVLSQQVRDMTTLEGGPSRVVSFFATHRRENRK